MIVANFGRIEYEVSAKIASDHPFYAILMAAFRNADSGNFEKLKSIFPDVCDDIIARYDAPGGVLPGEPGYEEIQEARREMGIGQ